MSKRIFVVDDSATDRAVIRRVLEKSGVPNTSIFEYEDASAAMTAAIAAPPDLILMDICMPGIDGYQATRKLKRTEATQAVKIVICSSKGEGTAIKYGELQGADAYVVKPFTPQEFRDKVFELLQ